MKVVSSQQMSQIEEIAYQEGASKSDFMEEAGSGVALVVHDYVEKNSLDHHVLLLCGKGNNAGDAYVAGIHLLHLEFDVFALQLIPIEECSSLCQTSFHRFINEGGRILTVNSPKDLVFPSNGVIIDGIFGTGFKGQVQEPYASLIHAANESRLPIISIDIPSGLNGETGRTEGDAIIATETAFLGLPKTGFFLRDGWNHVGKLRYVDFGLPQQYIDQSEADLIMLAADTMKPLLPPIVRNRHKYQAGYVVGLAGSVDMPGAAALASGAALKGGAGIVRLLHPEGTRFDMQGFPAEIIKASYKYEHTDEIIETMNKASATFIGPGLGRTDEVRHLLKAVLPNLKKPCVIDADALFLLSEEKITLPQDTILTPHAGELARLMKRTGYDPITIPFLLQCQAYAASMNATLLLKGGCSFIMQKDQPIMVNPKGTPGMATAGSGDVLTGLLAALLAQGLKPHDAACLGCFLHGLAGEHAAEELTPYCMLASDILFYFPEAFRFLEI
jgi:NAD(P)H-hydrate epimerase